MTTKNNICKTPKDKEAYFLFLKLMNDVSDEYGVDFDIDNLQIDIRYNQNQIIEIKMRPKKKFWQIWRN